MLKKTFIFAIRSFKKSRFINLLNILGLTFGLSVFFLISLFLYQEKSYEKDFSQRENIYQVSTHLYNLGNLAWTTKNLPHVLDQIPGIERFTQFDNRSKAKVSVGDNQFEELRVLLADSSFFKVFDFELISGDPSTVLNQPNMVVIKESVALKMFGTTDVVGKTLYMSKDTPLIVKGVSRAAHYKTQLDFDLVVSQAYTASINNKSWGSIGSFTYLLVNEKIKPEALNQQLTSISEQYIYRLFEEDAGSFEEWRDGDSYLGYFAEPLMSLRNASDTKNLLMPKQNVTQFNTLLLVGFAALIISMVNFINISTARASVRIKEVGVKRILGSSRQWLILQFMLEAFLLIVVSSLIALASVETIVQFSPDYLNGLVGYSVTHSSEWLFGLLVFIVLLTAFSGIYPALYLSGGSALGFLRSNPQRGFSAVNTVFIRKCATVVQLTLTFGLIAAVIIMFQQLDHLRNRNIGYDSSNIFIVDNTYKLGSSNDAFRQELMRLPTVETAAFADHFPNQSGVVGLSMTTKADNGNEAAVTPFRADPTFFDLMGMDFVLGESFKGGIAEERADTLQIKRYYPVVINETAVKAFGLEDPIGSVINDNRRVVGVVNDFVFSELRQSIAPVMIGQKSNRPYFKLAVKMAAGNFTIKEIEEVWSHFSNEKMVWYNFSNNYERLITVEDNAFKTVLTFSVFAVLISCLGLLGLASFTIDQRIKEFGIRKVLGASVLDISRLFGWGFLKLILLAFLVAIPISIYGLNLWLDDFADRVALSPLVFLLTGMLTVFIVLGTIIVQSLKAGRLNPVDVLRNE